MGMGTVTIISRIKLQFLIGTRILTVSSSSVCVLLKNKFLTSTSFADYICERSIISAGIILAIAVVLIFSVAVCFRWSNKCFCIVLPVAKSGDTVVDAKKVSPTRYKKLDAVDKAIQMVPSPEDSNAVVKKASPNSEVVALDGYQDVENLTGDDLKPSPFVQAYKSTDGLPRRSLEQYSSKEMHLKHQNPELFAYDDYADVNIPSVGGIVSDIVPELPEPINAKSNKLIFRLYTIMNRTRVPYFEWTLGSILTVILYLALNIICLFVAPDNNLGRGWGSLAACNVVILTIPACRNSILALGLGLPFDRVVIYHRFVGRFVLLCVIVHMLYYLNGASYNKFAFWTGIGALACCAFIFLTSLNYVRRNHFNVFFWSHYSFIAFLVLVFLHVPQTQPFVIAAVVLYGGDKLLRFLWMAWPNDTVLIKDKGNNVAQIVFPKNPITKRLEWHRVGQYYFVNFPELSHTEWHPFSVSSGPREETVEIHIRDLGDHTKRIVQLARDKEKKNESTRILLDGPYGSQTFDYLAYHTMLLVGGGIGITPVIGMLKDLYNINLSNGVIEKTSERNAIDTVYLLWVMPKIEDYETFRPELEALIKAAKDPNYPNLVCLIHISRSNEKSLNPPFYSGRPNVGQIFANMAKDQPLDHAVLVFACGPHLLIADLWDKSIQETRKGRLVDFHHEIFEF